MISTSCKVNYFCNTRFLLFFLSRWTFYHEFGFFCREITNFRCNPYIPQDLIHQAYTWYLIFIGPKSDYYLGLSLSQFLHMLNFAQIVGFLQVVARISLCNFMEWSTLINGFFNLLHWFVKIDTWIYPGCWMDLSKLICGFIYFYLHKLLHGLLKLLNGFVRVFLRISCPLPNKTKFDQDFKVCWSFCFEQ